MCVLDYCRVKTKRRLLAGEPVHWVDNHKTRSRYIRAAVLSYPLWMTRAQVQPLKDLADRLTKETGIQHVLDHIIPLNHPLVSGLGVPDNFQVITCLQNSYKGNTWNPDQLNLF